MFRSSVAIRLTPKLLKLHGLVLPPRGVLYQVSWGALGNAPEESRYWTAGFCSSRSTMVLVVSRPETDAEASETPESSGPVVLAEKAFTWVIIVPSRQHLYVAVLLLE